MAQQLSSEEKEQLVKEMLLYARQRLEDGMHAGLVERELIRKGYSADLTAAVMARTARDSRATRERAVVAARTSDGTVKMVGGALIFGVGALITAASYDAASSGGRYTVLWGAMLLGAIQFFRGLVLVIGPRLRMR